MCIKPAWDGFVPSHYSFPRDASVYGKKFGTARRPLPPQRSSVQRFFHHRTKRHPHRRRQRSRRADAAADKSGRRYLKDAGSPLVRDTTVNPNRAHDATDDTYDNNYSNGRDSSSGDNRTSVGSNSIPDSNSRCNSRCNRGRNTRARRQTSR